MKTTRFAVIFLLVFISMLMAFNFKVTRYSNVTEKKAEYNYALDAAMDAAVAGIVESADGNSVIVDKQECVDQFYKSLYAAFAAMDSDTTKAMLELYTPVLALADEDGLDVYYSDVVNDDVQKVWSQKIPYTRHFSMAVPSDPNGNIGYTINFTLGDELTLMIDGDTSVYKGHYSELQNDYANQKDSKYKRLKTVLKGDVLGEEGYFQLWRNQVVTDTITEKLGYYVNRHNRIAEMNGEQFKFVLPQSAASDVSRAVDSVSFMCFFQGYPFGKGTSEVYSNFEISGARVTKSAGYFTQAVDGYLYYHKPGCTKGSGTKKWYKTQEECAWQGALPCEYCHP